MTILLFFLSFLAVGVPLILGLRYATIQIVSPLHLVAYFAFFGILVKTIYFRLIGGQMFFQFYEVSEADILAGYIFVTGFVLMICLGYFASIGKVWRVPIGTQMRDAVLRIRAPYFLLFLSLLVTSLVLSNMLAVRGLGGLSSLLLLNTISALNSSKIIPIEGNSSYGASMTFVRIFLFLSTLAMSVFFARLILKRTLLGYGLVGLLVALNFFLITVQGSRIALVALVLNLMSISILTGTRFSLTSLFKGTLALVLVFALFVTMTSLRSHRDDTQDVTLEIWPAIEQILASTYFLDINVPILIIKLASDDSRFWGESYTYWTFAWIPRPIWPNKPDVTLGPYVKQEVLGLPGSGAINPTGPGEAFLNFGWPGMSVGLLLGWLYRQIEALTLSPRGLRKRGGMWIYPIIVIPFISATLQSSFSATFITSIVSYVLILLTLTLLQRRFVVRRRVRSNMHRQARLPQKRETNGGTEG